MSVAQLKQEDLRALEQTRQRLLVLQQSLLSLKADLIRGNPMPSWDSLQTQTSILEKNLRTVTDHLSQHDALFQRVVTYPSTNYPGRTEEAVLNTLLRKKAEPPVESWMEEGRALGLENEASGQSQGQEALWKFAADSMGSMVAQAALKIMSNDYTKEERAAGIENARTGLKVPPEDSEAKSEDGSDDGEDEDDDEEMEDSESLEEKTVKGPVAGARSLDDLIAFATTGRLPEDRG